MFKFPEEGRSETTETGEGVFVDPKIMVYFFFFTADINVFLYCISLKVMSTRILVAYLPIKRLLELGT